MNKSSSILLFILISSSIAGALENLVNANKKIPKLALNLLNTHQTFDDAVQNFLDIFNSVLSVQISFEGITSEEKLAEILSAGKFIRSNQRKALDVTETTIQELISEIRIEMTTISDETTKFMMAKKDGKVLSLSEEEIAALENNIFNQFSGVLTKISEIMQILLAGELSKHLADNDEKFFLSEQKENFKQINLEFLSVISPLINQSNMQFSALISRIQSKILEKNKEYFLNFYSPARSLAIMLTIPVQTLSRTIMSAVNLQATQDERINVELIDRVEKLISVMRILSGISKDNSQLIDLHTEILNYVENNEDDSQIVENKNLHFIIKKFKAIIISQFNELVTGEEVVELINHSLISDENLVVMNKKITKIINMHRASSSAVSFPLSSDQNRDIKQKLIVFNYLTHLKKEDKSRVQTVYPSNEEMKSIADNMFPLLDLSSTHLKLNSRVQALLNVDFISFSNNGKFYSDFYDFLLSFIEQVEQSASEEKFVELLDEYINRAYLDGNSFLSSHYLIVKLFNLLTVSSQAESETIFEKFEADSKVVTRTLNLMQSNNDLAIRFNNLYLSVISNTNPIPTDKVKIILAFAGQSFKTKLFSAVNHSIATSENITEIEGNIKKVEVHKKYGTSKSGTSRSGPSSKNSRTDKKKKSSGSNKSKIEQDNSDAFKSTMKNNDIESPIITSSESHVSESQSKINEESLEELDENDLHRKKDKPLKRKVVNSDGMNLVNQVIGTLPEDLETILKIGGLESFLNKIPEKQIIGNIEYHNTVIKVSRRNSPCHPGKVTKVQ